MRKLIFLLSILLIVSCKKDNTPPTLQMKTGVGYTTGNITLPPGGSFTVGVIADKGADILNMVYSEVAYDGANITTFVSRNYLSETEREHYEHDYIITCRNQGGTERWVFNVNDGNGRNAKVEIRVMVQ